MSNKYKNCKILGNPIGIPNAPKHHTRKKLFPKIVFLGIAYPAIKIYSVYQMPPIGVWVFGK